MRDILGWMVEQLCRPLDTKVCSIANLTDDPVDDAGAAFPRFYRRA
jgi:hypothetical protein